MGLWRDAIRLLGPFQPGKMLFLKFMGFNEGSLKLPDGSKIIIDFTQFPNVLANILHIYYCMDYAFMSEALPRAGWKIIDAGAYLGVYTLWAARRVGELGKIVALEPHPQNMRFLRKNIAVNGFRNVEALPYALSMCDGKCKLYSARYRALASLKKEHVGYFCGEVSEEYEVTCVSLKTLLKMLGLDKIDLLKLDIEGLECDVLKMSADALDHVERMVIEAHLDVCSIPELEEVLMKSGFKTFIKLDTLAENQAFIIALREKS